MLRPPGGRAARAATVTRPPAVPRWWSLLLVPGGFVAGHEMGYRLAAALGAASPPGAGHGYVGLVVPVGTPFVFAALARSFLAGLRHQPPPVGLRTLAAAHVALFLAVELAEHAAAGVGPGPTLAQPAVALGLAAQVLVAAALHLIVRTSGRAGRVVAAATAATAARRRRPTARPARWRPTLEPRPAAGVVPVWSVSRRGPPPVAI